MKSKAENMNKNDKATRNAQRLESMRRNLDALESRAAALLEKDDAMTAAERAALLQFVNVAFHEGASKIDGIYSIDGTSSCEFCATMRKAAEKDPAIICGGCYAYRDKWKEAAWRRHILNARILSNVLFTVEELKALNVPAAALVRINEDGDITNIIHARNVLRLFVAFPSASFGFWYKNVIAVAAALELEGITCKADKPRNVRFVHSSPRIGIPAAAVWFDDVIFTVYPDKETTAAAIAAGSFPCNGARCKACGFNCYHPERNADNVQHVAEVLRASAATVKMQRELYDARNM